MTEPANSLPLVDLHAHTNESDGSLSPAELIELARSTRVTTLAITDHDTVSGYTQAIELAHAAGVDLLCGIELNTKMPGNDVGARTAHLLAYFPNGAPSGEFSDWLASQQNARRARNRKLAESLRAQGIEITLAEVEARGRSLAGRPHFARILVDKGYAASTQDAFDRFIGEQAPCFVERQSISTEDAIRIVRRSHGAPVLAHPVRLNLPRDEEREMILRFKDAGLLGLEVFHSEHPAELQSYYGELAAGLDLLPTGGSDFHGTVKPRVRLGTGFNGNVRVPRDTVERLRTLPV